MSDTRRPRSNGSPQHSELRAVLERMDQRQAAEFQELHKSVQGLRDHVGRTDARIEGLAQDLQREVTHIDTRLGRMFETNQTDIKALQDALERHERTTVEAAASGAASGAVAAAITPEAASTLVKTKILGMLGKSAVPAIALFLLIKEGPPIVRAVGGFFGWLGSLN